MTIPNPSPEYLLDRQCEQRSEPGYLTAVLGAESYKVVLFHRGRALMSGAALAYLAPNGNEPPAGATFVYLGKVAPGQQHQLPEGTDIVLLSLPNDNSDFPAVNDADVNDADVNDADGRLPWQPQGTEFAGYRDVAQGLNAIDAQVFVEAQAVANWHSTHVRCAGCGNPTEPESAGWMRRCVKDGSEHFPRTDPAAIVAIVGADDRILLANNFQWAENRYSTVAGFVEAGESAEQAAVREIVEEVGVHLHSLSYISSQAWPFPRSLMLGFIGHTRDIDAVPDRREVRAVRWFTRRELQAAVLSGEAVISHRLSIARSLIEQWYGGIILEPGEQA